MKKVGIISIYGNDNFGNKLQNYAICKKCELLSVNAEVIKNGSTRYTFIKNEILFNVFMKIKNILNQYIYSRGYKNKNFKIFEKKYIKTSPYFAYNHLSNYKISNFFDYFIVGSDQVWNPNFGLKGDLCFLEFVNNKPKIAFSASFGVDSIPKKFYERYINGINNLDYISVREYEGKKIIEKLTKRTDVEVLIDPTMLLTKEQWQCISKKPKKLGNKKYILNYFLGNLSFDIKEQINKFAEQKGWEVINILDKNDKFYNSGPSEFIYLEEHAELICTDSFHSCVFGILMETPFVVFDRDDHNESMNSRIDTLLYKFGLQNRKYNGELFEKLLDFDFILINKILEEERKKANNFLLKSLDIKNK